MRSGGGSEEEGDDENSRHSPDVGGDSVDEEDAEAAQAELENAAARGAEDLNATPRLRFVLAPAAPAEDGAGEVADRLDGARQEKRARRPSAVMRDAWDAKETAAEEERRRRRAASQAARRRAARDAATHPSPQQGLITAGASVSPAALLARRAFHSSVATAPVAAVPAGLHRRAAPSTVQAGRASLPSPRFRVRGVGRALFTGADRGEVDATRLAERPCRVVVLHPGSTELRLGFAESLMPHTIPHVLARRARSDARAKSAPLPQLWDVDRACSAAWLLRNADEVDGAAEAQRVEMMPPRRQPPPPAEVIEAHNAKLRASRPPLPYTDVLDGVEPDADDDEGHDAASADSTSLKRPRAEDDEAGADAGAEPKQEVLHGLLAVAAQEDPDYVLRWPLYRGRFAVGPAYSLSEVREDLYELWKHALVEVLRTPVPFSGPLRQPSFAGYSAVLVLPDAMDRRELSELMDLLLVRFGFDAVLVQPEMASAAYSFGASNACVVDIGDSRTTVACLTDGSVEVDSRVIVPVGSRDIAALLMYLLSRAGARHHFPLRVADVLPSAFGARLAAFLKIRFARLDLARRATEVYEFAAPTPAAGSSRRAAVETRYRANCSDEVYVAPMALFNPSLRVPVAESACGLEKLGFAVAASGLEDDLRGDALAAPSLRSDLVRQQAPRLMNVPLHEAVLASIQSVSRREWRRRLFSTVLLVGGGSKVDGLRELLQQRLSDAVEALGAVGGDERCVVAVLSTTKNSVADPRHASWSGGCVISHMEASLDLWVTAAAWGSSFRRVSAPC